MKFRKKPVVIEAEQWWPDKQIDGVCTECKLADEIGPHVHTLEGALYIRPGDWIVTGIKGEKYAVKPDIFKATYELVGDEDDEA